MKLNYASYKDKVKACWIGKNIGGTLGGPYEGVRKKLNITGFSTAKGEPLPNDDLDLQLVWLHAMEIEGPKHLTAEVLGDYWLSYITMYAGEYAIARRNMELGIIPPLTGETENNWRLKHSNGAWIRTEIWATLFPAQPDMAARYAIEDAKVDHGNGEGTYAAMFVAALESAAFVVSDIRKLIEIGLAKIPYESRMARTIRLLLDCYDNGVPAMDARDAILKENYDIGDGWFSAPSNVGYAILGILYGEGDFKKSMLLAVNCGDDTDCTAGTVGSILGIMKGTAGISQDWEEYIGDKIVTCSINQGTAFPFVGTCTKLTEKVTTLAPTVTLQMKGHFAKTPVFVKDEATEVSAEEITYFALPYGQSEESEELAASLLSLKTPNTIVKNCGAVYALVTVHGGPYAVAGEQKRISIMFQNRLKAFGQQPHNIKVSLIMPEGWTANAEEFDVYVPFWMSITENTFNCLPTEIVLTAPEKISAHNRILILVEEYGRYHVEAIPVMLLNRLSEKPYLYEDRFNNYGL
ncbi:MAG: ADP-ribosylglycohydrolase family protein [Clostridia bacterium]|nr:ADP-ribosylglycohydrolase family protein [Clostridia bacterium]